jgi:polyvinyl alcohol dehydrogenase (cytochrome)
VENTRFQSAAHAGLTAAAVPSLKLKWAFGFPNVTTMWAQPTVVGGRLFVGSADGTVYALNAKTGCVIWTFTADAGVRTAISVGARAGTSTYGAYFGDIGGNAYAIDASSGALIWKRRVDEHPLTRVTGAPALYRDRLYVPLSGLSEEMASPEYRCCTFRGGVAALDVKTGEIQWKSYVIEQESKPNGKIKPNGAELWGPAGASIWSAPTIDVKRGALYVGTGNMFTDPAQPTSNAIVAMDLATGKIKWAFQGTPNDVARCAPKGTSLCGPDVDFGSSPILVTRPGGRDLIIAGQKSGVGWALDPDQKGKVVWQYRGGQGGTLGGIEFGSATDDAHAYFAISDLHTTSALDKPGSLHAVSLSTGERVWRTPAPDPLCKQQGMACSGAQTAAITVIPGVVFSGSIDGGFRAYSTKDGSVLWTFDTNREFETINKVPAKGGSMSGPGAAVVGGMVYTNSGYHFAYGQSGNVLLAFGPE